MLFHNSQCKNNWLHDFKIVGEYLEGVQERCVKCGQKKFFRTIQGQTSNKDYISFHMKQVLPSIHRLFKHEFPNAKENK